MVSWICFSIVCKVKKQERVRGRERERGREISMATYWQSLHLHDGWTVVIVLFSLPGICLNSFVIKNLKKGRVHLSSQEHSGNANINIWQMNVVNTEEQLNSTKQFTWKCHFKPQDCTLYFSCVSAFWKKKCRKTLISSKSVCLLGKMLV